MTKPTTPGRREEWRAPADIAAWPLWRLKRWVDGLPLSRYPDIIAVLRQDPRRGAQELAHRCELRWQAHERRLTQWEERFHYERRLWQQGIGRVAGVDEAGRGPLAGPVVAAAVILDPASRLLGVDDSKRLPADEREELAKAIRREARAYAVAVADAAEIDRINIAQAAFQAMRRAVGGLRPAPEYLLVDGFRLPGTELPQEGIVGGDRLSNSIAAASILAKVTRDAIMRRYDQVFPGYGFAEHKGYPTPEHREAIRRLGPTPIHRRSFSWL